jgi:hypothetical protein
VIPSLAVVRVGGHQRRTIRLWLPLFLLWPLLLPLAVVLAVAGPLVARAYGVATTGVLRATWEFVSGWRGMDIEVDAPGAAFRIQFI